MRARQNVTAFENNEKPIIDLLDRHLASAIDLQLRLRSALWNFEDPRLDDRLKLERLGNARSIEKAAAGFTDLDTVEICGCAPEIIRGRVQRGLARLVELLPAQSSALCSQ
jgi:hypothetical protein